MPAIENQELVFPYLVGPPFVRALLAEGGQRRLDAAFADPPTTTEHVLHPHRYLAREEAKAVAEPAAPDGLAVGRGVLGELRLLLLLSAAMRREAAEAAASGWGGDRYVTWEHAGQSCATVHFVMDTEHDSRQLVSALQRLAAKRAGATVGWDGTTITLAACR